MSRIDYAAEEAAHAARMMDPTTYPWALYMAENRTPVCAFATEEQAVEHLGMGNDDGLIYHVARRADAGFDPRPAGGEGRQ